MSDPKENQQENIKDLKEKVARYGYQDGMVEISIGITYLFLGLMLFFYKATPIRPLYAVIFVLTCWGILFAGGIWLLRKLKGRFVWDKIGYSITRGSYPKTLWVFLGLSLLSAAFAVFSIRLFSPEITIASFGCCFFFGLISQFFQAGKIRRFLYISFVPLFAVGICILLGLFWKQSIVVMFISIGSVFIVSGVIVYKAFRGRYDE